MQAPAISGDIAPGRDAYVPTIRPGEDAGTAGDHHSSARSASERGLAILARLRASTAPAHEQVESRLFPSALDDLASYRRMLAVLLALHEPLEQHFANQAGFIGVGIDVAERRKSAVLRDDLACLDTLLGSATPPLSPVAEPATATAPGSLPAALGAFYVLEGSTLGGRFLLPQVRERLGDVPTSFLVGYGDRTGRLWKQTRTALVRGVNEAPHPASAEHALLTGAAATFVRLDALLDAADWPAA
jgi:heme oxygenase